MAEKTPDLKKQAIKVSKKAAKDIKGRLKQFAEFTAKHEDGRKIVLDTALASMLFYSLTVSHLALRAELVKQGKRLPIYNPVPDMLFSVALVAMLDKADDKGSQIVLLTIFSIIGGGVFAEGLSAIAVKWGEEVTKNPVMLLFGPGAFLIKFAGNAITDELPDSLHNWLFS